MTPSEQALLVAAGLIVPLVIATVCSTRALKILGAWALSRAVALEDARMHYAMTRTAEHATLCRQYAIGNKPAERLEPLPFPQAR